MSAPYQVVQAVFDNAVATATNLSTQTAAQIAGISGSLSSLTLPNQVSVPGFTLPTITIPTIPAITVPTYAIPSTSITPDTFAADYAAKLADAQASITGQMTSFFQTYFPMTLVDTELTLAQNWVINVLSNGGAMNPSIENQYWQRDRDRIARETSVKIDEATSLWASRGFALPPGAAIGAVALLQRTGLEQLAQSSREVAIKKYETEVALQQKAIELAIDLRLKAMTSMVDFIKTIVFAPRESAQQFAAISEAATKAANDTLTSYFSATTQANINLIEAQARVSIATTSNQVEVAKLGVDSAVKISDLQLRSDLGRTDIAVRQNETSGTWSLTIASKRVEAMLAAAHMTATMASAALNGIHATAGVSGSDSTNTQLFG